ncbi:MAG: L-serine ammonia-lyase [Lewinellaceae bacterium]|nr:L-serine ammonia-lyase [Lewinellaceae bacterium]
MEFISVFDVFKIGVGPSSSHTLGPWKAALDFCHECLDRFGTSPMSIQVSLYGSLSLTGLGHATDKAIILGLSGYDPEFIDVSKIDDILEQVKTDKCLLLGGKHCITFSPENQIIFEQEFLPTHANGMIFRCFVSDDAIFTQDYYSTGGGFILKGEVHEHADQKIFLHPFSIQTSKDLINFCNHHQLSISQLVLTNETSYLPQDIIYSKLLEIWNVMMESMFLGCHSTGVLPGGLSVKRRANQTMQLLLRGQQDYSNPEEWMEVIRKENSGFHDILKWISSFAIGVNEVNASLGRVVTAPTNGSAGVIPAVLMYYLCFVNPKAGDEEIISFLCTAGEIGSIFKKGSTISAAMGGCQAEIGVSSAMAAAGLTELLGGSPYQCTIAAEIAMEHHLGMTCDPVNGLVQIPCIERNSMGAIKAINAATIAIDRQHGDAKVELDDVIKTMWETAKDMNRKYKETSEGGLATSVRIIDC